MELEVSGIEKNSLFKNKLLEKINKNERKKQIKNIFEKKNRDMLGWLDLVDLSNSEIEKIEAFSVKIQKKYKNFVILGIGGSALGVKMLKHAFFDSINRTEKIKTYVCDNIDSDYFISLINSLDLRKTVFNVITKSGTTCETLAQFSIVLKLLEDKKLKIKDHVFVTTTKDNELYNFARQKELVCFDIPKSVGGRFSVLSNVGLVPAAIMGLDIKALLEGAKLVKDNSKILGLENLAYTSAFINYVCLKNNLTNLVFMPYSERLALVSDYFAQLWAESLGKRFNLNNEEVFTGQTPIKALGVTDQHSQLQLYTEGIKDKMFIFLKPKKNDIDFKLDYEFSFMPKLNKISLGELFDKEFNATRFSLTSLDRPNYTIFLDKVDEKNMGMLIFYLQMMTAFMGEMLNVDAYNQNGVEASKIYTKASLNFDGLKKEKEEIENFVKNQKFYKV